MNMELTFPEDAQDARARSDRNLSELERWASIAAGAGLAVYGLTRLKRNGWMHAGVGALLLRRGVTAHCDVYEALGMNTAANADDTRAALRGSRGVNVLESVTINRPISELYRFWRNLENLPRFMAHLESVQMLDERRSRWSARLPAGKTVEWDGEVVEDRPGELISWRPLPGTKVMSTGSVRFLRAPGGRGTEVRVELRHDPAGGLIGAGIARLFGEVIGLHAESDLRRFKQLMEIGEVVQSDASVHVGPHPAQPPRGQRGPEPSAQSLFSSTEGAVR